MASALESIYASLRADLLSRHFPLGHFWRTNHFTNVNVLGQIGDCFVPPAGHVRKRDSDIRPCLPRLSGHARYVTPAVDPIGDRVPKPIEQTPLGVSEVERWRVWNHDHGNGVLMTGLRLMQLCVDHRLGNPVASKVVLSALQTTEALMKYPADADFGGYILRWDPVADDNWRLKIDRSDAIPKVTPTVPGDFLLNPDPAKDRWSKQPYLYCTPLDDPRYLHEGVGNRDKYRRWEPSKDEYIGLVMGLSAVWDTFPAGTPQHDLVLGQAQRIARYLQKHAYLLVRPCGGVTIRGCGEILPLLEFVLNRVFKKILGDAFESSRSYADVLADAGIHVPQLTATASLVIQQNLLDAIGGTRQWLLDHHVPNLPGGDDLTGHLTTAQQVEFYWFWQSRGVIDALDTQMQTEVLVGYLFNRMPRNVRQAMFEKWMASVNPGGSDGFKPMLALMTLNDDDDFIRKNYLLWFDKQFSNPPHTNVRDDEAPDWSFATAVAMLVAHRQGDAARHAKYGSWVEQQLREMGDQILADNALVSSDRARPLLVFGAASSPLKNGEMVDQAGLSCGADAPHSVVSEIHDKAGNWYGFMPVLALAWRHLLDGAPSPFSAASNIVRPTGTSAAGWPAPFVPAAVIKEARRDPIQMLLPLASLSASVPQPDGSHDVSLFIDPPARATDAEIARRYSPMPIGETVTFDFAGGMVAGHSSQEWTFPALTEVPDDEIPDWVPVATVEITTNVLSDHWTLQRTPVNNKVRLDMWLKAAALQADPHIPRPRPLHAHVAGNVRMAWVPK